MNVGCKTRLLFAWSVVSAAMLTVCCCDSRKTTLASIKKPLSLTTNTHSFVSKRGVNTDINVVYNGTGVLYREVYFENSLYFRSYYVNGQLCIAESDNDRNGSLETVAIYDSDGAYTWIEFRKAEDGSVLAVNKNSIEDAFENEGE